MRRTGKPFKSSKHNDQIQPILDLLALAAAWYATIEVRLFLNPLMRVQIDREFLRSLAPPIAIILLLWIAAVLWLRFYRKDFGVGPDGALQSAIVASTLVTVVAFFSREFGIDTSRSFVILFLPVCLFMLLLARGATRMVVVLLEKKWPTQERVAMLGEGIEVRRMFDSVSYTGNGTFQVAGVILPAGASAAGLGNPVPVLGTTRQLAEVINRERIDRILVAEEVVIPRQELDECVRISEQMGVILSRAVHDHSPYTRLEFRMYPGLNLLELKPVYFTREQERVKRTFDIMAASVLLILMAPVMALFAIMIKITSPGPIFYTSPRVGRGGRYFTFLKFRSMYYRSSNDANRGEVQAQNEKDGHLFKIRNDPRITPLGRFMRHYSIDELPQLINVLRGDMSLVGPRPLPASDLDPDGQSRQFRLWSEQRSRVLPGISGLWQIRGRGELTFEKMMELDLEYIRRWTLALDLRILLATPRAVLLGRGAY